MEERDKEEKDGRIEGKKEGIKKEWEEGCDKA